MIKDDKEVMKIRAGVIAGGKAVAESPGESMMVVEFLLGIEKYAIAGSFVTEVLSFRNLTRIPLTPKFIAGLINIRGKIISVVNLMSFLNRKQATSSEHKKILVIKYKQMEFGIMVDEITGTRQLDLSALGIPPVAIKGTGGDYILGVTPEGVILLNAVTILTDDKIIVNQK